MNQSENKKYSERVNEFQYMSNEQVLKLRAKAREELSHIVPFDKENRFQPAVSKLDRINRECEARGIGMGKR